MVTQEIRNSATETENLGLNKGFCFHYQAKNTSVPLSVHEDTQGKKQCKGGNGRKKDFKNALRKQS